MSHPPPPCPESELMPMPAPVKHHSISNSWIPNTVVWCATTVMPCSLLQRARPCRQHSLSQHHSHCGSWVTNMDMFIRGTSQPLGTVNSAFKAQGLECSGWAAMSKLTSLTINSAVFAIKDSARPCITTDITDIKHCIRRGCNGLS